MLRFEINDLAVYHGARSETNEPYVSHFAAQDKDVSHFLRDVVGRERRYRIDPARENTLTMAENAAKELLKKTGVPGSALDLILFSSLLPEYVMPPSAVILHHALGGGSRCVCYDMNSNCVGMAVAMKQAAQFLETTPGARYALVVGSDYMNLLTDPDNEYAAGHYGDAACAMLITRTERDAGLVDSEHFTDSSDYTAALMPRGGFSNAVTRRDFDELYIHVKPFTDNSVIVDAATNGIADVMARNGLTVKDISAFCFSQAIYRMTETLRERLSIPEEKNVFIGREYGYTATSSPFIVLAESIRRGMVKRGDYVLVWTVGAGVQSVVSLLRY